MSGHSSLVLEGDRLFPRVPTFAVGDLVIAHGFPTEGGHPFRWGSKIEDVTSASIDVLEWISSEGWKKDHAMEGPLRIFMSYSHDDEVFVTRLKKCLRPLERRGIVDPWYDRELLPGSNFDDTIAQQVDEADIFVFLLSDSFLASDYCTGIELKRALERARDGQACLVGIVIRPCMWKTEFPKELMTLPKDAKPITTWDFDDNAWLSITEGLKRLTDHLRQTPKPWMNMQPTTE